MKTIKLYLEAATKLVGASVLHPNTDHRIIFRSDRVDVVPATDTPSVIRPK